MKGRTVALVVALAAMVVAYPIVALTFFRTTDPPGIRSGFAIPAAASAAAEVDPTAIPSTVSENVGGPTPVADPTPEADPDPGRSDGPLRIGLLVSATDESLVAHYLEVAHDTVVAINDAGGVGGSPVELVELPHEGNADVGDAYEAALAAGDLDVVVGPMRVSGVSRLVEVIDPSLPVVAPSDFFETASVPGYLSVRARWSLLGGAADTLLGGAGDTVVIVTRDTLSTTLAAVDTAVAELESAGVAVDVMSLDPDAPASGAASAAAAGADAIGLVGVAGASDEILAALVDAGVDPSATEIVLIGDRLNLRSGLGSLAAGVRSVAPDFGAGRDLADTYGEITLAPEVVHLRDSLVLIATAATDLHAREVRLDGPALAEAIIAASRDGSPCTELSECLLAAAAGVDVDVDGLSGPIELGDDGSATVLVAAVNTYGPDGTVIPEAELVEVSAS